MNNFGYRINRMFPSWYQTLSDKVCQWLSTGQWFSPGPPPIKLTPRYSWNIVESGAKHHQTNKHFKCLCYYFSFLCFRVCVCVRVCGCIGGIFVFLCVFCLFVFVYSFVWLLVFAWFFCVFSFIFLFLCLCPVSFLFRKPIKLQQNDKSSQFYTCLFDNISWNEEII